MKNFTEALIKEYTSSDTALLKSGIQAIILLLSVFGIRIQ
jgi:hypothetical protein